VSPYKTISAALCLIAMGFFAAWPVYKWLNAKAVNASIETRTKELVEQNPQLQPAWTIALQDGVLTYPEAKVIIEAAGEKIEPEK
jgi:hypothetical protein